MVVERLRPRHYEILKFVNLDLGKQLSEVVARKNVGIQAKLTRNFKDTKKIGKYSKKFLEIDVAKCRPNTPKKKTKT